MPCACPSISFGPSVSASADNTFSGSTTFTGAVAITKTAQASTAEDMLTLRVSDDSVGKLELKNVSATDSRFVPMIRATDAATSSALQILAQCTTDTGTSPAAYIDGRTAASGALSTRPCFSVLNNGTSLVRFTAAGGVAISGGTTPSILVGASGTAITQIRVYSPTIDPASVAAASCAEQTFTVTGLTTADKVIVNASSTLAASGVGIVNARVSAADTLAVTFINPTAGAIDVGSSTWSVVAIRS